jgi:hypothetical protein
VNAPTERQRALALGIMAATCVIALVALSVLWSRVGTVAEICSVALVAAGALIARISGSRMGMRGGKSSPILLIAAAVAGPLLAQASDGVGVLISGFVAGYLGCACWLLWRRGSPRGAQRAEL